MRLFLSYARVDKPYCVQVAGVLKIHEVWLDDRLYAGQKWWQEIMRRLEWCEGFVYLLSEDSIQSQYCRREFELAKQKGKHIFPALIQPGVALPDELLDMQYADLSGGLNADGVTALLNAIHLAERKSSQPSPRPQPVLPPRMVRPSSPQPPTPPSDPMAVIGKAADAMENGQFDDAVFMLRQAMEQGLKSRFINIEALLREAEAHLEWQTRQREMEREYNYIAELAKRTRTRKLGCEAFINFQRDFPNYDPENIALLCVAEQAETSVENVASPAYTMRNSIPLLEWCQIPSGNLPITSGKNGHTQHDTIFVEPFFLSRYPVTNYQFQMFVDDPTGYANPRWWDFSQFARSWRMENPEPLPSQFQGDDRPRENITWYEAMAYCNWLTEQIGLRVTLPTRQQWQRAAKCDDNRVLSVGQRV